MKVLIELPDLSDYEITLLGSLDRDHRECWSEIYETDDRYRVSWLNRLTVLGLVTAVIDATRESCLISITVIGEQVLAALQSSDGAP